MSDLRAALELARDYIIDVATDSDGMDPATDILIAIDAALASAPDEGPLLGFVNSDPNRPLDQEPRPAAPVALDVERLAEAIEAAGCTPSCGDCGADIDYHGECPEGDGHLVWEVDAEAIAREYAALSEPKSRGGLDAVASSLDFALSFHNQTPSGMPKECLPECIACAARREYAAFSESIR